MKRSSVLALIVAIAFIPLRTQSETFKFNTGSYVWNDINNWVEGTVPNAAAATAILPGPNTTTGDDLSIALDVGVTLGTLDIQKPTTGNVGDTSITGTNTLTMTGGSPSLITNRASAANSGTTTIATPIQIGTTLTINQESNSLLQFDGAISGGTGLTIARTGTNGGGARTVVLATANTYGGNTMLIGSTNNNNNFLIVRLGNVNSIPAASNILSNTGSVVLESSGTFQRTIGAGTALQFAGGSTRNGWGAVGGDLSITLNGGAAITWGQATWNELVLGTSSSTHTAIVTNPLVLNGSALRIVRTFDGSAAIDGTFSNTLSGTQGLHKQEGGVLSLEVANTYAGNTIIEGGVLLINDPDALPSTPTSGNLQIGGGGTLGIGADMSPTDADVDFSREIGTDQNQIQLAVPTGAAGGNQANVGFSAHGGNRTVRLGGGEDGSPLVWGTNFMSGGSGTVNRNFILSDETADGTLIFKNPIDLNGADRTIIPRNGSAEIDAELRGVITGTGGLIQDNSGTLLLSNANDYTGNTSILRGRLLASNTSGSATSSGTVTLNGTSILGGIGTIGGAVTANSGTRIQPGLPSDLNGILNVGSASLLAGSILDIQLGGTDFPTGFDRLSSDAGNITIDMTGAGATLNVSLINGFMPAINDAFHVVTAGGGLTGEFAVENLPELDAGQWQVDYFPNFLLLSVVDEVVNDADFNNDGVIDAADYVVWAKFNPATGTGTQPTGDANGDGDIDGDDYSIWVQNFGDPAPGGGNGGAVPEPGTLALFSVVSLLTIGWRNRCMRA